MKTPLPKLRFPLLLAGLGVLLALPASAQPRDPMRAPSAAPATASAQRGGTAALAAAPAAPAVQPRHIVSAGDCRYVVERGRRYGPGDLLGGARIEAIDESAVTLREADQTLRRVPLYGTVQKKAVVEAALLPAPDRSRSPAVSAPAFPPASPPLRAAARCAAAHPG